MKSVGEVMAIGRKFEEALQKALRMLDIGAKGVVVNLQYKFDDLEKSLKSPSDEECLQLLKHWDLAYSVNRIYELTHIDKWFLYKVKKHC